MLDGEIVYFGDESFHKRLIERETAISSIREKNRVKADLDLQNKLGGNLLRDGKIQIGSKVCPAMPNNGEYIFAWLKGVNPDSSKIQVRIPEKIVQSNGVILSPYIHGIIWDKPDKWQICE